MLLSLSLSVVQSLTVAPAQAFCGTYVGSADATLTNEASRMGIARQDGRTTLTLLNDVQGDSTRFGLLIPIPEAISEEDVQVVETTVIDEVDLYTSPRLVAYACSDFADSGWDDWGHSDVWDSGRSRRRGLGGCRDGDGYMDSGGWADSSASGWDSGGVEPESAQVTIEERFSVGEYELTVLQAVSEEGLNAWLVNQGFELNEATEAALADYVAAESWFVAATVDLEPGTEQAWLSALQIAYTDEAYTLPIRLGTASSAGEQDLVLFVVDEGAVGVSNYPERVLEDECMLPEGEDFDAYWEATFAGGILDEGRATWTLEYGWPGHTECDPCPPGSPTDDGLMPLAMLEGLGWEGGAGNAYLSRVHMRYAPEAIDQDLALYATDDSSRTSQVRYIDYSWAMEDRFPVCGLGWAEDPGSCDAAEAEGTGCAAGGLLAPGLFGLLGLGLARRRRGR